MPTSLTRRLALVVGVRDRQALSRIAALEKRIGILGSRIRRQFRTATFAVGGLALALGGMGLATIKVASDFEQVKIALTTMLGSAERARKFLGEMEDFAKRTPFEFKDLLDASKRMLALGFAAEEILPSMRAIGNAVAALGGGKPLLDRIVLALGQMRAKGRVTAEEMRQLTEAGIPAWETLARVLGTNVAGAMDMVSKRLVSSAKAVPALIESLGTRFAGLMEKQARTVEGRFSNLKDTLFFIMRDIGERLTQTLRVKERLQVVTDWLDANQPRIVETADSFARAAESAVKWTIANRELLATLGKFTILLVVGGFVAGLLSNIIQLILVVGKLTFRLGGPVGLAAMIGLTIGAFLGLRSRIKEVQDPLADFKDEVGQVAIAVTRMRDRLEEAGVTMKTTFSEEAPRNLKRLREGLRAAGIDFARSFSGLPAVTALAPQPRRLPTRPLPVRQVGAIRGARSLQGVVAEMVGGRAPTADLREREMAATRSFLEEQVEMVRTAEEAKRRELELTFQFWRDRMREMGPLHASVFAGIEGAAVGFFDAVRASSAAFFAHQTKNLLNFGTLSEQVAFSAKAAFLDMIAGQLEALAKKLAVQSFEALGTALLFGSPNAFAAAAKFAAGAALAGGAAAAVAGAAAGTRATAARALREDLGTFGNRPEEEQGADVTGAGRGTTRFNVSRGPTNLTVAPVTTFNVASGAILIIGDNDLETSSETLGELISRQVKEMFKVGDLD